MRLYLLQLAVIVMAAVCLPASVAMAQGMVTVAGTVSPLLAGANDLGALPISQTVSGVVLQLQPTAAQQADLAQFLSAVTDSSSTQYRKWLTAAQFADRFGSSQTQVDALTAWLSGYGLQVTLVAQGRGFVVVSGTAAQVQRAFGVQLERFQLADGTTGFANVADPVLPAAIAAGIANIRGLNDFGYAPVATVKALVAAQAATAATVMNASPLLAQGVNGAGVMLALANSSEAAAARAIAPAASVSDGSSATVDSLLAAAESIDANAVPLLRVAGGCVASLTAGDMAWFESVAAQANAQGITLVAATADCASGAAFPASLSEVTAVGVLPGAFNAAAEFARPTWQNAAGVPLDGLRHTPDLAVGSTVEAGDAAAFAGGIALVVQKAGGLRQGNVNSILYTLANRAGVFSQTSSTSGLRALATDTSSTTAASYDTLTGLGTPDLTTLLDYWPMAGSTASNTSIISNNYSPTHGQSFTLTAMVSPTDATGTVNFYSGGTTYLGTANLSGGTATLAVSTLAGGTYALTAAYQGDSTYATSTSGQATVTVLPETSTISAVVNGTPAIGVPITVTVKVTGASGVGNPAGVITVAPQGLSYSSSGMGTLVATGTGYSTATVTVSLGQAGTFTLLSSCVPSDQNFTCSSPASTQVTVTAGTTGTVLTISPNPPTAGSPITMTATVTPAVSGTNVASPTGSVTFLDGTTALTTATVTSGVATGTATLSPGATHALTAKYVGDTNFTTSTSPVVNAAGGTIATTTGLSSSSYASSYGTNVTFTAVVAAVSGVTTTLTPTGKVNFYSNGTLLGSATLASGVANYSTTTLPVGLDSVTATYVGDTNFATSASTVYNGVTVSAATGTLAATISPASAAYGTTATLTATLTLASGGTPAGTITATIPGTGGGIYSGTLVANTGGSATATIVVNVPPPGTYTITVACATATTNYTCASTTVTLTATKGTTTTTVSAVPVAPLAGQATQLTAIIANAGAGTGSYTFTGSVTFYDNGAVIGTAAVASNQGTTSVTFKANVVHSITAVYSGDTSWTGSTSSALALTATASPTTTTLGTNLTTALVGTNVILTATVTASSSSLLVIPTGSVTFYDTYNGVVTTLGTAALVAAGPYASMATLTTTGLQGGTHNIFSIYTGDGNFAPSTGATLVITEQDFSLVFVPSSLTLTRGQSGQVTVILGTVGGFTGNIVFGCTPPPDTETTCSFLPSTIASGGSTVLYIGTTAPNAVKGTQTAGNSLRMLIPVTMAGLLLLLPIGQKKIRAGLLVLLMAVALSNGGCASVDVGDGSSSGGGGTTTGTPQGTMNFTITASGTSSGSSGQYIVRHTTSYMVTAQ